MRTILAALMLCVLSGCKFDQGPRMELDEFLRRVAEEEQEFARDDRILPDPKRLGLNTGPYFVGPGDVLEIGIVGLSSPGVGSSFNRRVNADGTISLPLLEKDKERLAVAGLDVEKIEAAVARKYSPDLIRDPQVVVGVTQFKTIPVVMVGQVGTPGVVNLKRDELNLLTAIARAGWLKDHSSGNVTVKPADGGPEESFRLWLASGISQATGRTLQAGDVVAVERRPTESIYVTGLVKSPGQVELPQGARINFLQLFAKAGGVEDITDAREATLLRVAADGELLRVRIDLNRMINASDPNFEMKAGDILDVYHTDRTRTLQFTLMLIDMGFRLSQYGAGGIGGGGIGGFGGNNNNNNSSNNN